MQLSPDLQRMFNEKTMKLSREFHELECCNDKTHNFESLKNCLDLMKRYINHFQDYYFPEIQKSHGLESMVEELKMKQQSYIETCMEFNEITPNDDIQELSNCLKMACEYLKLIESNLEELGFKLS